MAALLSLDLRLSDPVTELWRKVAEGLQGEELLAACGKIGVEMIVLTSTDSVLISTLTVLISTESVLISTESVLISTESVLISTDSVLISTGIRPGVTTSHNFF